jgi:hypothetical protein
MKPAAFCSVAVIGPIKLLVADHQTGKNRHIWLRDRTACSAALPVMTIKFCSLKLRFLFLRLSSVSL